MITVLSLVLLAFNCFVTFALRRERIFVFEQTGCAVGVLVLGWNVMQSFHPPPVEESIVIGPPLTVEFTTLNGGNNRLQNVLYGSSPSFYLGVYIASKTPFRDPGLSDAEYFALTRGQPVCAPAAGTVHEVVSDLPDMTPGKQDHAHVLGNFVSLRLPADRYVYLTNLEQSSITVQPGEAVHAGQIIGRVGLSGKTTEPSVFMVVVDRPSLFDPDVISIPFYFADVERTGSGDPRGPFFPVRNDHFAPHTP